MDAKTFWSPDRRFGLALSEHVVAELLRQCRGVARTETGGVLVGRYSPGHDCAIVDIVSGPGTDARAGGNWLERGTEGLQALLARAWHERRYYLGEWHFHPGGSADPSPADLFQMAEIARSVRYRCPEPILVVVGGGVKGWQFSAHVFPRGRVVALAPEGEPNGDEARIDRASAGSPKQEERR